MLNIGCLISLLIPFLIPAMNHNKIVDSFMACYVNWSKKMNVIPRMYPNPNQPLISKIFW